MHVEEKPYHVVDKVILHGAVHRLRGRLDLSDFHRRRRLAPVSPRNSISCSGGGNEMRLVCVSCIRSLVQSRTRSNRVPRSGMNRNYLITFFFNLTLSFQFLPTSILAALGSEKGHNRNSQIESSPVNSNDSSHIRGKW